MSARPGRGEIRLTQSVGAPVERVWQALVAPRQMAGWQADEVFGEVVVGGIVSLAWPALDVSFQLEVLEMVAMKRVVFGSGEARLALDVHEGSVELTHSGLAEGDELEGVASSWRVSLGILAHYCEQHPERDRRVHWLVEPATVGAETAHVFFTESDALASWLGTGSSVGSNGARYELELGNGERMSGSVLANTPGRDVALVWEEDERSVICMRTLPRPFTKPERLIVLSWSRWSEQPAPAERLEFLRSAHVRLTRALSATFSA